MSDMDPRTRSSCEKSLTFDKNESPFDEKSKGSEC